MTGRNRSLLVAAAGPLLAIVAGCGGPAGGGGDATPSDLFVKQEAMIPMRDGVRLHTEIYLPRDLAGPLPVLLERTPYGLAHDPDGFHVSLGGSYRELVEDGYIFVFQDIRGRYDSEGEFVMLRPPRTDSAGIDEGTDTYDTVDWLLTNLEGHNGRVGILGISYGGWLTAMAMIRPHPAVAAVSPQASPSDMFIGDDFHHNGAFRLAPGFGYVALMERGRTVTPWNFNPADAFQFYLDLGPLSRVNDEHFDGAYPTWNDFVAHPDYDEFWRRQETSQYLTDVTVPTLHVAGWFDAEDFYGPLEIYRALEREDEGNESSLVVGPWRHGGWASDRGDSLGAVGFGEATGARFRRDVQRRWFAHHLKGEGELRPPEAYVFQTGTNRWQCFAAWPPVSRTEERALYFRSGGRLEFLPPEATGAGGFDEYLSDPADPVPYRRRPMPGFWQGAHALWKVEDQRFASNRPDVVSWWTEPLEEEVAIAGAPVVRLYASTTGTDADWIVKLIDVFPEDTFPEGRFNVVDGDAGALMDGYQMLLASEVLRARYRNSFSEPEPVPSATPVAYTIDLRDRNHVFRRGHRIMIQVQSTWFPLIDRNPQTYVDSIFRAEASDFRRATQRIYRSADLPSHVALPVLTGVGGESCSFQAGGGDA